MPAAAAACLGLLAYVVPLAMSYSTMPSPNHPQIMSWYLTLKQPGFKPPDVAIPLAWTLIETGLAVAAYRLFRQPSSDSRTASLALLAGNTVAIGGWSRLFFGRQNLPASTFAAAAMVATGAAYVSVARPADAVASSLGKPFVAWVAFATVLTAAIWRLNRE